MRITNNKGFTLVELIVSVGIVMMLAAIAVPEFNAIKKRAYDVKSISTLKSITTSYLAINKEDLSYDPSDSSSNPIWITKFFGDTEPQSPSGWSDASREALQFVQAVNPGVFSDPKVHIRIGDYVSTDSLKISIAHCNGSDAAATGIWALVGFGSSAMYYKYEENTSVITAGFTVSKTDAGGRLAFKSNCP